MERSELITKVKSLNVKTDKPAHMMKTQDLLALVNKYVKGAEVKEVTMKSRILELFNSGSSTGEIKVVLEQEGWASKMKCGKIRPVYINLVVKTN